MVFFEKTKITAAYKCINLFFTALPVLKAVLTPNISYEAERD